MRNSMISGPKQGPSAPRSQKVESPNILPSSLDKFLNNILANPYYIVLITMLNIYILIGNEILGTISNKVLI